MNRINQTFSTWKADFNDFRFENFSLVKNKGFFRANPIVLFYSKFTELLARGIDLVLSKDQSRLLEIRRIENSPVPGYKIPIEVIRESRSIQDKINLESIPTLTANLWLAVGVIGVIGVILFCGYKITPIREKFEKIFSSPLVKLIRNNLLIGSLLLILTKLIVGEYLDLKLRLGLLLLFTLISVGLNLRKRIKIPIKFLIKKLIGWEFYSTNSEDQAVFLIRENYVEVKSTASKLPEIIHRIYFDVSYFVQYLFFMVYYYITYIRMLIDFNPLIYIFSYYFLVLFIVTLNSAFWLSLIGFFLICTRLLVYIGNENNLNEIKLQMYNLDLNPHILNRGLKLSNYNIFLIVCWNLKEINFLNKNFELNDSDIFHYIRCMLTIHNRDQELINLLKTKFQKNELNFEFKKNQEENIKGAIITVFLNQVKFLQNLKLSSISENFPRIFSRVKLIRNNLILGSLLLIITKLLVGEYLDLKLRVGLLLLFTLISVVINLRERIKIPIKSFLRMALGFQNYESTSFDLPKWYILENYLENSVGIKKILKIIYFEITWLQNDLFTKFYIFITGFRLLIDQFQYTDIILYYIFIWNILYLDYFNIINYISLILILSKLLVYIMENNLLEIKQQIYILGFNDEILENSIKINYNNIILFMLWNIRTLEFNITMTDFNNLLSKYVPFWIADELTAGCTKIKFTYIKKNINYFTSEIFIIFCGTNINEIELKLYPYAFHGLFRKFKNRQIHLLKKDDKTYVFSEATTENNTFLEGFYLWDLPHRNLNLSQNSFGGVCKTSKEEKFISKLFPESKLKEIINCDQRILQYESRFNEKDFFKIQRASVESTKIDHLFELSIYYFQTIKFSHEYREKNISIKYIANRISENANFTELNILLKQKQSEILFSEKVFWKKIAEKKELSITERCDQLSFRNSEKILNDLLLINNGESAKKYTLEFLAEYNSPEAIVSRELKTKERRNLQEMKYELDKQESPYKSFKDAFFDNKD